MKLVKDIIETKGKEIFSIEPGATVYEALKLMADKGIGALLVMDGGDLSGIISERDYARKIILQGRSSKETAVKDLMTTKVMCITPEQNVEDCMAIMIEKRIRHLPVLDNNELTGVISIGDVLKAIIADKSHEIDQLTTYIKGHV